MFPTEGMTILRTAILYRSLWKSVRALSDLVIESDARLSWLIESLIMLIDIGSVPFLTLLTRSARPFVFGFDDYVVNDSHAKVWLSSMSLLMRSVVRKSHVN